MDKLKYLKNEIADLERTLRSKKARLRSSEATITKFRLLGWNEMEFHSEYRGSHPERESDEHKLYFFKPGLDFSKWVGGSYHHLSRGGSEDYEAFEDWIDNLEIDIDYVEVWLE